MKVFDFITVGGGAAGLFANINLPKNSTKLILERNKLLGIKVLMSGGERANFTNLEIQPEKYVSDNPKAVIVFLNRFTQYDIINFFEENGVGWEVEDNFRVITKSGHARDIVNVLISKVKENKTDFVLNCEVKDITKIDNIYEIQANKGNFYAKNVIISTGGKSYPQAGTKGFGYKIAQKFGLKINYLHKGLVGIVLKNVKKQLSGTTVNAKLTLFEDGKEKFSQINSLLFTHWGISGIVSYNATLYGKYLDFNPERYKIKIEFLIQDNKLVATKRLKKVHNLTMENNFIYLQPNGLKSWAEAKVTAGGVDTNELTKYLESKKNSGLFFIGEVVDITGYTGGFNLQWAWSSAYCMADKFNKMSI